ncbi:MAG: hypothetical protein HZB82_03220 [Deltaproteobacteria bacterium]|nr:hypothetical protein [Deltaproteobacteria bacterium]
MSREIGTLAKLKTGLKAKVRAIPSASAGTYLDIHVATLERTRLERELKAVNERKNRLEKVIEALQNKIDRMDTARLGGNGRKAQRRVDAGIKRPVKTIVQDY